MNLFDLLERHQGPLINGISRADVAVESAKVAAWLRSHSVERGDRVVVDLKNGLDAVASVFAISRIGGIVVGGSPQWSPTQLEHVLTDSGAKALITSDLRAKQVKHPNVLVRGDRSETLTERWDDRVTVPAEDPAILIYTSGTTGKPKGVIHTHKNLGDFARIVATYLENDANDRLIWMLGWSFGYGLSQLLSMCWSGGQLFAPASMLPADILKAHQEHKTTALAQVPYGWDQIVTFLEKTNQKLEGLRYVTNAGDGPSLALLERLEPAIPGAKIILMYGQTECLRTTYLPADRYHEKRGSMGFPIPEVEVEVTEDGELLHRGALLSPGYWNAPEATKQKLEGGVLRTGDIVRKDEDGCLWYVGRSERMIKSSGFRFSPSEIEDALRGELVTDVAVFGVPDPALGQAVEAAVVSTAAADAILAPAKRKLPRYMLPRRIHVVSEIPRNSRGKLDLEKLRALGSAAT